MRIIFCNITYMKNYCGADNDIPVNGGKCYGYFMHYGDILHIERIENTSLSDKVAEDVLVVWVAKPDEKNSHSVIVGWYRHADVYRYVIDDDCHNIVAKAENCHLLPVDKRKFIIPRASQNGKGKGMGQSAIWYADSEYAKKEFVPKVVDYISKYEKNDGAFINKVWTEKN